MRHTLITTQLLHEAYDAAIARAVTEERLGHQARAIPHSRTETGRFAGVVTLARRVRALAARTIPRPRDPFSKAGGGHMPSPVAQLPQQVQTRSSPGPP